MKTFQEFLLIEMPTVNTMTDKERNIPPLDESAKSIGKISSGHTIFHHRSGSEHNFWAVKDNVPSFHMSTHHSFDTDNHTVMSVSKQKTEKSYKAVDVYKHLLKKGISLVGVDHSEGAKKIWGSLWSDKDVKLEPVSSATHEIVGKLPPNFSDVYKPNMRGIALKASWNGKTKVNKSIVPKEPERFSVRDFLAKRIAQQQQAKRKPIISESPDYMENYGVSNRGDFGLEHKKLKNWPSAHKKMIADIGTHEIWKLSLPYNPDKDKFTQFYAVNKKTKRPTHVITGTIRGNTLKETGLYSTSSKEAKAGLTMTDLYAHILHSGEIKAVHSDHLHSPGGANVWKRLAQRRDISTKHVDSAPKREVGIDHDNWRNNYRSSSSYFVATKKNKEKV